MSLKTGLFQLLYFTFLHNADAIAYMIGIIFIFVLLLKKPSRVLVLFLLGFIVLEIRFQYLKHIVDPLYDQTVGAMLQEGTFFRTRRLIDLLLNDLVPLGLFFVGWGCVFAGIFFSSFSPRTISRWFKTH
jgi:hypothetical protein